MMHVGAQLHAGAISIASECCYCITSIERWCSIVTTSVYLDGVVKMNLFWSFSPGGYQYTHSFNQLLFTTDMIMFVHHYCLCASFTA